MICIKLNQTKAFKKENANARYPYKLKLRKIFNKKQKKLK